MRLKRRGLEAVTLLKSRRAYSGGDAKREAGGDAVNLRTAQMRKLRRADTAEFSDVNRLIDWSLARASGSPLRLRCRSWCRGLLARTLRLSRCWCRCCGLFGRRRGCRRRPVAAAAPHEESRNQCQNNKTADDPSSAARAGSDAGVVLDIRIDLRICLRAILRVGIHSRLPSNGRCLTTSGTGQSSCITKKKKSNLPNRLS
jgi:hypothetical protein